MKLTKDQESRVEDWSDERQYGHGYIVTLHYGWSFEFACHEGVRGFDTKAEAIQGVKYSTRCDCPECKSNVNN